MRDITEHKRAQQAEAELEQNRRLTQLIQTRLEEERRAIARELHDELGQCVTAIKTIGAAIANRTEAQRCPRSTRNAQTIVQVAGHIYDVVHGIIRQLRPSALDHLGLQDALEDWVEHLAQPPSGDRTAICSLAGDLDDLGETVNITVYRIIQECLTNVVRHAGADRAQIEVQRTGDARRGHGADNGKGLGERKRDGSRALRPDGHARARAGVGRRVRAGPPSRAAA